MSKNGNNHQMDIEVCSEEKIHQGYFSVSKYKIKVKALNPAKKELHLEKEMMLCKDSIMVLIYAKNIDSFVLCQQFRPAVFFNKANDNPYILECIAGTMDKEKSPEEIAKDEAWEEAGVVLDHLEKVAVAYKSPGLMTEKAHFYYGETTKTPQAGYYGIENEDILTHVISREKIYSMMDNGEIMDTATLFLLNWYRVGKLSSEA